MTVCFVRFLGEAPDLQAPQINPGNANLLELFFFVAEARKTHGNLIIGKRSSAVV